MMIVSLMPTTVMLIEKLFELLRYCLNNYTVFSKDLLFFVIMLTFIPNLKFLALIPGTADAGYI